VTGSEPTIGVALSGGGHRATVWGVGVLLYLADAGCQRRVSAISSVSGGSIANGVVAHRVDYAQSDASAVRDAVRPLLRHVAHEGLFVWGRATNKYVAAMLGCCGLGTVLVVYWLLRSVVVGATHLRGWEHALGLVGLLCLLLGLTLLGRRSRVLDAALGRVHFSDGTRQTQLSDVSRSLDHIFCATDLQAGRHFYLAPGFLYSYTTKWGSPAGVPLSTAVQCSACLPGAFGPRTLMLGTERVVLVDGGVYDNMADQWLVGLADRVRRASAAGQSLPVRSPRVDDVVIANSGGTYQRKTLRGVGFPVVGDLRTLKLVNDVMYSVTTSHRRQQLVRRDVAARNESAASGSSTAQRSALVHITQSPYDVARAFAAGGDDDLARRAAAVLALLGPDEERRWRELAHRSTQVRTTLGRLGEGRTVDLLEHSYVLAMCNLHVLFGYPLLPLPFRAGLEELTREAGEARPADPASAAPPRRPVRH
jgi:predicted acylesterase/phospholipase RssA